ncbi:hypothetical protein EUX53_23505 [Pseudomonas orientalis]|nr:hypothetical protein EUX53_23505 [Pseudomonas orientalis]
MLAKNVNDNARFLDKRGALGFFASKLAPTRAVTFARQIYAQSAPGRSTVSGAPRCVFSNNNKRTHHHEVIQTYAARHCPGPARPAGDGRFGSPENRFFHRRPAP